MRRVTRFTCAAHWPNLILTGVKPQLVNRDDRLCYGCREVFYVRASHWWKKMAMK